MMAIYKKEIHMFFNSMIGYVILASMLLVSNFLYYLLNIYMYPNSDLNYLFYYMLMMMIAVAPIMTMRSFTEEYKAKTDQLLFTAPVSVCDVVLGKFFAYLTLFATALFMTAPWVIIIAFYSTPNYAQIAYSYIALFLAGASLLSIGMYASSLTENQIISFILSGGASLLMFIISTYNFGQNINEIVDWISIFCRFNYIKAGILSMGDICYYISFAFAFLFLTVRHIKKKRCL